MLKRFFTIVILILFSSSYGISQVKDTVTKTSPKKDSVNKYHSPKKAALYSTFLPGLGQVYNKKYWKVPFLYAGFIGLGYYFEYNQSRYVKYRDAYKDRVDGDSTTIDKYVGYYSNNTLYDYQQAFHRYRDIAIIGISLLYVLNIVDASVDGHLYSFDVSDNLSATIKPQIIYTASNHNYQTGLSLTLNLK